MNWLQTQWTRENFIKFSGFVAFLSLVFAYIAQYGFGVTPCVLCYYERYLYWAIVILGGISLKIENFLLFRLLGLVLFIGVLLGIYHLGVEKHWWKGLAACYSPLPKVGSIEELRQFLRQALHARCDQVNWRIFGISATLWNLLWFLGFMILWYLTVLRSGDSTHNSLESNHK